MPRLQRLTMLFHKNITCSYPELIYIVVPYLLHIINQYCTVVHYSQLHLHFKSLNVTSFSFPATAAKLLNSPNKLRSSSLGPEDKQTTLLIICANNMNYLIIKPSAGAAVNSIF